jgi:serine protease AprX
MKYKIFLLILISLLGAARPINLSKYASTWQAKIDPTVLDQAAQGPTEFLVYLNEQADLSPAAVLKTRQEKGEYVFERLSETAQRSQAPLVAALQAQGVEYRAYWIANMLWVRGDLNALQLVAQRPEVDHIYANPSIHLDLPTSPPSFSPDGEKEGVNGGMDERSLAAIEWNIQKVHAPNVWAAGITGQGAVIGGQDTGYKWDHPALKAQYRGWDGSAADHNYAWHDAIHENNLNTKAGNPCGFNLLVPCDDQAHGTHTMGTMVGDDGQGNQIGMAPGASWIGCRNMEEGWGTPATYTECFQWFVAPTDLNGQNPRPDLAPDVINNSWSCPPQEGCAWDSLQQVVENTRAAGIVVVVSAGNSGSSCGTVNTPPAIYDASFSVGATDKEDLIAGFSSRGSSNPTNLPKPNISAPGVSIRSSTPAGPYTSMSGTSMAAPHVSGLVALLISANPSLRGEVEEIREVIERSARPLTTTENCGGVSGSQIPNNTYGWGRIDAWAAFQAVRPDLFQFIYLPVVAWP